MLLSACGAAPAAPRPAQVNGINGGIMFASGAPILVYAMDVRTGSNHRITGHGILTEGTLEIYVDVTGSTGVGTANLTFRDRVGDTISIATNQDGQIYRGTWNTSFSRDSGTTRFTHESNIDNLSVQRTDPTNFNTLTDLFGVGEH